MRRTIPGVLATLLLLVAGCGTNRIFPVSGMVEVEPNVIDFGRVALGSTAVRELTVHNRGRAPLLLKDIQIEGLGQDIEIINRGGPQLAGGKSTVLAVRYSPQAEEVLERLLDLAVDDEERPEVAVPVTGVGVRPRVTADPPQLDFGRIELGVAELRTLILRNEFDMPVTVRLGRRGDVQYSFSPADTLTVPPLGSMVVGATFRPARTGRAVGLVGLMPCATCDEQLVPMNGIGIDQALVVTPDVIDFQYVPVDRTTTRDFTLTNVGTRTLQIGRMWLEEGAVFGVDEDQASGMTLEEGQQIPITLHFTPGSKGEQTDTLYIESSSARAPVSQIAVRGVGGGPEIKVTVRDGGQCLDFGETPLGSRPHRFVTISNIGADPEAPPLEVTNIFPVPGSSPLFGTDVEVPILIPTGESVDVPIWYEPNAQSIGATDSGLIAITSNDGSQPEIQVCAVGSASNAEPCTGLEVTPSQINFGTLDEKRGAALSIKIRNVGDTTCIIRRLGIAPGSADVFWTHAFESYDIEPFGWFGWEVYFDPARVQAPLGDYVGELELYAINQGNQRYAVPLVARSGDGCLVPEPRFLDFGHDPAGCGTRGHSVTVTNVCSVPVTVSDISLGEPSTPGEFEIAAAPGTPMLVGGGENFTVSVTWNSITRGINSVPLYITEDSRSGPLMVPLKAELTAEGVVRDQFVQHTAGKTDMLLVIDNSFTMREEQVQLLTSVGTLVDEANSRGIDYRIAVTTTGIRQPSDPTLPACPGGANGAEAGRFFPVDESNPRIITPATANGAQILAENTQVGLCHQEEEGMQAMRLALSEPLVSGSNAGFLRDDANLAVLFVSEEDDHSGFPVGDFLDFLTGLKGLGGAKANALVDINDQCTDTSGIATRYMELVGATGGISSSICGGNWAGVFANMAAQAFTERTAFTLSQTPDGTGMEVLVNGMQSPPTDWTFDAGSNSITFTSRPPAGARITVNYTASCFGAP